MWFDVIWYIDSHKLLCTWSHLRDISHDHQDPHLSWLRLHITLRQDAEGDGDVVAVATLDPVFKTFEDFEHQKSTEWSECYLEMRKRVEFFISPLIDISHNWEHVESRHEFVGEIALGPSDH